MMEYEDNMELEAESIYFIKKKKRWWFGSVKWRCSFVWSELMKDWSNGVGEFEYVMGAPLGKLP